MSMPWRSLKLEILQWVGRLVGIDVLADSSADGEDDRATGHAVGPEDPETPMPLKRRGHYPFYSRPPDGAELTIIAGFGGHNNRAYISSHLPGQAPELEKGEAAIKTVHGHTITLSKDGRITLATSHDSKVEIREDGGIVLEGANGGKIEIVGATGQIRLNGSTLAVIKSGDGVIPSGDLLTFFGALSAATGVPVPPTLSMTIGSVQSNDMSVVTS